VGCDEVQHGTVLIAAFFKDSLPLPQMRAYSNLALQVAPGFNLDAPRSTNFVVLLKAHGTGHDGTFNVYEDASCDLPDGTHPVLGGAARWRMPFEQRGGARTARDCSS
jgi:hypothetical protein